MAHYEGETLKERIERGPLALDDAVDIATQVSNRNGGPGDMDDNGFISRVSPDGRVLDLKWIDGTDAT